MDYSNTIVPYTAQLLFTSLKIVMSEKNMTSIKWVSCVVQRNKCIKSVMSEKN